MTVITVKYEYKENPVVYTTNSYRFKDNLLCFYAHNKQFAISINLDAVEELEIMNIDDITEG